MKKIVAVTACPTGVAHTYMAAASLKKAAAKLGVEIKVEKQGASGAEDELTIDDLKAADGAILAADVAIKDVGRFDHLLAVECSVAEPLKDGEGIIRMLLEALVEEERGKQG
ncbi:MAG: fructose PTS transporter subunit IIB [Negativicutes bacterium]|nr:fructose PTS transporter subunit IIB [Negativicutes bacterium]